MLETDMGIIVMDVLAFIASPFSASTCPPRLKAAMTARLLDESAPAVWAEAPPDGQAAPLNLHQPAGPSLTTTTSSTNSWRS